MKRKRERDRTRERMATLILVVGASLVIAASVAPIWWLP